MIFDIGVVHSVIRCFKGRIRLVSIPRSVYSLVLDCVGVKCVCIDCKECSDGYINNHT